MNIRIQTLTLTNFKCFKGEHSFDFGGKDIITVSGNNGKGKTTIADSIIWCLFGKNAAGQSDFDLKTHKDGSNEPIPNLDHSVELSLSISELIHDGKDENASAVKDITLKRVLKEVWVKKRGSDEMVFKNNSTDYFINGESYTATDYKKYISEIVYEDVFRAITNPTYFTSLNWKTQREFLTQLVPDDDMDSRVIVNNEELSNFITELNNSGESIEDYLKHRSYQIKEIRKKIDLIPTRLEEQNKALPERLDWDDIEIEKKQAELKLKDIESIILELQNGNGADVKRSELRSRISTTTMAIDKLEIDARAVSQNEEGVKNKAIQEASLRFNEALNNQKLMEQAIEADKRLIERLKETDYEKELEYLRSEWPSGKFEIDESKGYCPTCGQPLPQEQWQEKVEQMEADFNLRKEAKKKELNERAEKVKQQQAEAAAEIKKLEEKLAADTKSLSDIKESINTIFSEKAKIEKQTVKTKEEILAETPEYMKLSKQLQELKEALANVTDNDNDSKALDDLKAMRCTVQEGISTLTTQLASRIQYDRILALIDTIKEEEKDLVKQLSKLEQQEDIAREYQKRMNILLEERINERFSITRWRLFRTVNNGGDPFDEPYCECYVDGVAYHDGLNQAARLNAGLDIINALCKFYGISAPIIIDNAESSLTILKTSGQQIHLQVAPTELTII